jgi:hypothetical protein
VLKRLVPSSLPIVASALLTACGPAATVDDPGNDPDEIADLGKADTTGPGRLATDSRVPELGSDPTVVLQSKIKLSAALAQSEAGSGPTIEAKFELDDSGALSLSVYPAGKPLTADAENNVFQELAGDPTVSPWAPSLSPFTDEEHLVRSARDLTLVQLSSIGVAQAAARIERYGTVFWSIPTIRTGRAGYGVYKLKANGKVAWSWVDGGGKAHDPWFWYIDDLGAGPGAGATDQRVPELGNDPTIVRQSKTTMAGALAAVGGRYGAAIEAKFEIGDDGKLSLSIYPTGKGTSVDAEENSFQELAGDPTASPFAPTLSTFAVPDAEHLTRSSRDLTLVQTAALTLEQAVDLVDDQLPGGFVFWAIPTIRATESGYGVYALDAQDQVHYFFVH